MAGLMQDLHYSLRSLARTKLLTAALALTLAIGIGCNAAIFVFVDHLLLRPLPYEQPEELVTLWEVKRQDPGSESPASPSNLNDWAARNRSFESIGAFTLWMPNLTGANEAERLVGASVSATYFTTLRTKPQLGRIFTAEEDQPAGSGVVVISDSLWHRQFGGDRSILGRQILLSDESYTVVGVLQEGFRHPSPEYYDQVEVWKPLGLAPEPGDRGGRYVNVFARLRPGVGVDPARADMDSIARQLERDYPASNADWTVAVQPLRQELVGDLRGALLLINLGSLFLLIIACVNVTNLLLSRSAAKAREVRIRVALGASRALLLRQPLIESLVLALLGGGLGLLLASWGVRLFNSIIPDPLPDGTELGLTLRSIGFVALLTLLAGLLCGTLPALQTTWRRRVSVRETPSTDGRLGGAWKAGLVVAEIALTLPLLVGGVLLVESFANLNSVDLGFRPSGLVLFEVSPSRVKYGGIEDRVACFDQLCSRLAALPGVESVALANNAPFTIWNTSNYFTPEGWQERPGRDQPESEFRSVSHNYFQTLGIQVLRGRAFAAGDRAGAPGVVVISHSLAQRYWPGQDPIGKRLTFEDPAAGEWLSVVGVVADIRGSEVSADPQPTIYRPYAQAPPRFATVVLREIPGAGPRAGEIREAVRQVDKELAVANLQLMEANIADSLAGEKSRMTLLVLFALAALVLSTVGLYALLAHLVDQRRPEFGIRLAMGASRIDIIRAAMLRGLRISILGIVAGLLLAIVLARGLEATLYGVEAFHHTVFAAGILCQAAVAVLACYLPSRKAARLDPVAILRSA